MNKTPKQIVKDLDIKFTKNFSDWEELSDPKLGNSFIALKAISKAGEILGNKSRSKHHQICRSIYDEIFSDGVSAIYLAANAMDKPAYIVLRRVMELGVAAIYLWDMPHDAYSWEEKDHSLSFTSMLTHINSTGFRKYVAETNSCTLESEIFPTVRCQEIYGSLSDTVHGKITTFESSLTERFTFNEADWLTFISSIEEILTILMKSFLKRYDISEEIFEVIPGTKTLFQ